MPTEEQIKRLTIEARTTGVAEAARTVESVATAQAKVAQASDSAAAATDRSEKTVARAGQAYDRLMRTIDPMARATSAFERDMRTLNRALEQGVIQAEEFARASQLVSGRYPAMMQGPSSPYAAQMAAAAEAARADKAQAGYASLYGIGGQSKSAADSAALFEAQFRAEEELAAAAAKLKAATDPLGTAQAALNAQVQEATRLYEAGALSASEYATAQAALGQRLDEVRGKMAAAASPFAAQAEAAAAEARAADRQRLYDVGFGIGGQSKSAADSAAVFEAAARATEDMERKVAALRGQIDPLGTLQARLNAQLAEYRQYAAQGAISTQELATAEALAAKHIHDMQTALTLSGGVLGKTGQNARLTAYEMTNLGMQMNDVVTMLAMGASPFQVLASQGGQIYQVMSMSAGGVGGAMSAILGLFSPMVVGIAAVGAAVALAGKVWWDYDNALIEARRSMVGVAAATGSTQTSFVALSERVASANNISVASARSMALAFAQTGKASEGMIGAVLANVRYYAATVGTDVTTAGGELARAFADPARGAEELNAKLGFLDDKTRHYIETLSSSGDRQQAQAVLLKAMVPSLDDAANHVTSLGAAWNFVASAASNAAAASGRAVAAALPGSGVGMDWQGQINVLLRERAGLAKANPSSQMFGNVTMEDLLPGANDKRLKEIDDQISWYRRQMAAEQVAAAERARQVDLNGRSLTVGASARGVIPGYDNFERLQNEQEAARKLLADPEGRLKVDIDKVTEAMERRANALKSMTDATGRYITPAENQAEILRVQARMELDRKNPSALARDQAELQRLSLYGQALTNRERDSLISAASSKGVNALGQQRSESWTNALKDFDKATEQARVQQNVLGLSAAAMAKLRAETDLQAQAMKIYGVDSVEALDRVDRGIRRQIELKAEQRAADAALAEQRNNVFQAENLLATSMTDGITGLLMRTESAKDALKSLVGSLLQATVQATLLGQGPLAGLFGTASNSPTQVGGLFGALFKGFSGFHAAGGDIPAGGWGIAGEAGPEVIKGPASVIPLGKLASGGGSNSFSTAISVNVTGGNGDPAADHQTANTVVNAVRTMIDARLAQFVEQQTRGRGVLSRRTAEA